MSIVKPTDISDFIAALDAGTLEPRLAHIVSDMATAVMDYSKKGKVNLELEFVPFNKGPQVQVNAVLKFNRPTSRGKSTEEQKSVTLFYVNEKGNLTDFPESQHDMFRKEKTATATTTTTEPSEGK